MIWLVTSLVVKGLHNGVHPLICFLVLLMRFWVGTFQFLFLRSLCFLWFVGVRNFLLILYMLMIGDTKTLQHLISF